MGAPRAYDRDVRRLAVGIAIVLMAMVAPAGAHAAGWLPLRAVSNAGLDAGPPDVAITKQGDQIAAFYRYNPSPATNGAIFLDVKAADGTTSSTIISTTATSNPAVAVDPDGYAVAVWNDANGMEAAERPPGGTFTQIPTPGLGAGAQPAVALTTSGTAVVAWWDGTRLLAAQRPRGGSFGAPVVLRGPAGYITASVTVAADHGGHALIAWTTLSEGDVEAELGANFFDGSTIGAMTLVGHVADPSGFTVLPTPYYCYHDVSGFDVASCERPRIAFDASDNAYLTVQYEMLDSATTTTYVDVFRRPAGAASPWSAVSAPEGGIVGGSPSSRVRDPDIAVDGAGVPVAVWQATVYSNPTSNGLHVATGTAGADFPASPTIDTLASEAPSSRLDEYPRIATLADGSLITVWVHGNAIESALRPLGGPFARIADAAPEPTNPVLPASQTASLAAGPRLATDAAGDAIVGWTRQDGANYRAQTAVYDGSPPVLGGVSIPATATAGQAVSFSATATDALSPATIAWDFGDGGSASTATGAHTYATPGTYTAKATATDAADNSASATRTVTVTAPPQPQQQTTTTCTTTCTTPPPATPQVLALSIRPSRFAVASGATAVSAATPKGTRISYTLSLAATATLRIERLQTGRRSGARCVKPTRALAHRRRCTRAVLAGTLTRRAAAGANTLAFTGRIGRTALRPGSYRLTLTAATDAAHASAPRRASFVVVR